MNRANRRRVGAAGAAVAVVAAVLLFGGERPTRTTGPVTLVEVRVGHGLGADRAVGVVVGPERVLTVAHLVDGARRVTVTRAADRAAGSSARPGRRRPAVARPAGVLAVDRRADAAVLRVPGLGGSALGLAPGTDARVVLRLREGRPEPSGVGAADPLVAQVSGNDGVTVRRPVLRLGLAVRPGDSGSPVLDSRGRLAGIVFATDEDHPAVAWATATSGLRGLLDRR